MKLGQARVFSRSFKNQLHTNVKKDCAESENISKFT